MDTNKQIIQNTENKDRISAAKTIYDASIQEIFWKNFFAGLGRSLGSVFIYLLAMSVFFILFMSFVFPLIAPYLGSLKSALDSLQSLGGNKISLPGDINSLFPVR